MKRHHIVAGICSLAFIVGGAGVIDSTTNPYTEVGNTLQITTTSTIPEAGVEKTIVDTTQPKVSLTKFNDEVQLGVTYTGLAPNTTGSRPFLSKNVEWSDGNQKMQEIPLDPTPQMEDGGVEINIILNSVPASNVFTFKLDNWENLDFFYQAPLWQEMGLLSSQSNCTDTACNINDEISQRSINVVGSYAVYYKEHKDHREGSTNYATGKAYHIFRPQVVDTNGKTIWADLSYLDGILTVTVDKNFLLTATYPVTIDPVFGKTAIGASINNVQANSIEATHFVLLNDGANVTQLTIYSKNNTATHNMKGVMYNQSALKPLTLLASSTGVSITTTPLWRNYAFIVPVTIDNGVYWLGAVSDDIDDDIFFDAGAANSSYFSSPVAGVYTNPFVTWSDFANSRTRIQSNYATYTIAPGQHKFILMPNHEGIINSKRKVIIQ